MVPRVSRTASGRKAWVRKNEEELGTLVDVYLGPHKEVKPLPSGLGV